jgi:hypothetical protein
MEDIALVVFGGLAVLVLSVFFDVADCVCTVDHPPADLPARCPATCNSENCAAIAS